MKKCFALAIGLVWGAFGCSGTYQNPGQGGTTARAPDAKVDITKAGMPYKILRAKGGQEVDRDTFYQEISQADAICVGERHTDPHHHWAQLEVVGKVSEKRAVKARALGMEMFQRPFQAVLDDFAGKRISHQDLLARTGWKKRWGYDFALYGPILDFAVDRGMSLLALNISNELRKKISSEGMDALTQAERARVPELVLDDEEHMAWFDGVMKRMAESHPPASGKNPHKANPHKANPHKVSPHGANPHKVNPHGANPHGANPHKVNPHGANPHGANPHKANPHGAKPSGHEGHPHVMPHAPKRAPSRLYRGQVLWDETMADTASKWTTAGDDRQIIILAGNGHCHDSAIVRRMKRRGVAKVVSVRPLVDDGDDDLAAELAQPVADYLLVMTLPR